MTETIAATEELKKALAGEEGARRWVRRISIVIGAGLTLAAPFAWRATHRPAPPPKYSVAPVARGDILENVQATGTVQPLLQVNVGAQVSGRVTKVYVDYNSVVKKGDVLAEIDPLIYGTQVSAQEANVAAARAQLEQAKANAASMQASLDTAKVAAERTRKLFEQNLASRADLDTANGNLATANAQYLAALATVSSQTAAIGAGAAQLRQSNANLGYTKIYSPVDGVVVTRGIDPGATVQSSFQVAVLFVIAQDLHQMRILADVDEADVGKIQDDMETDCVVDAFPGEVFRGRVSQIRYSPNNVSGVVTYSAVVDVANPENKLRPGMTTTITVHTHEAHGVLRVPNAALRYRPTPPTGPDGKPILQPPETPLPKGQARVWLLTSDKPGDEKDEMRIVHVGITDGLYTEVSDAQLPEGARVVTDESDSADPKKKRTF